MTSKQPSGNTTSASIKLPEKASVQMPDEHMPPKNMSFGMLYIGLDTMRLSSSHDASETEILSWMT